MLRGILESHLLTGGRSNNAIKRAAFAPSTPPPPFEDRRKSKGGISLPLLLRILLKLRGMIIKIQGVPSFLFPFCSFFPLPLLFLPLVMPPKKEGGNGHFSGAAQMGGAPPSPAQLCPYGTPFPFLFPAMSPPIAVVSLHCPRSLLRLFFPFPRFYIHFSRPRGQQLDPLDPFLAIFNTLFWGSVYSPKLATHASPQVHSKMSSDLFSSLPLG